MKKLTCMNQGGLSQGNLSKYEEKHGKLQIMCTTCQQNTIQIVLKYTKEQYILFLDIYNMINEKRYEKKIGMILLCVSSMKVEGVVSFTDVLSFLDQCLAFSSA